MVYNLDANKLAAQLYHESAHTMKPDIIGDNGHSHGIAQIHDKYHPEVSVAQANDPNFAIDFMARQIRTDADWFASNYPGHDSEELGRAAYNAGRGGVIKALKEGKPFEAYTSNDYVSTVERIVDGWIA
jgi:fructose 1,6-bisphosphatase